MNSVKLYLHNFKKWYNIYNILKGGQKMWIAVFIIGICYVLYRIGWALFKPIFVFIYESILEVLMSSSMSERAAKAFVSLIIIILILIVISQCHLKRRYPFGICLLNGYLLSLKFTIIWCSWERKYITNILHTSQVHHHSFKSKSKSTVFTSSIFS